jgi:Protein of unknown function (DUF2785)
MYLGTRGLWGGPYDCAVADWQKVIDTGGSLPEAPARASDIAELCEALRSPDPVLRDEQALTLLVSWIPGLDPAERHALGDTMAARFGDPEIQARTFAPLVLAAVVEQGDYEPSWLAAFAQWYPAETDLRGYDPELGWLHAVAHGADLLGTFGLCPHADPAPLLGLAADRLLARTSYLFAHQEDDRLAFAIGRTLTRQELSEADTAGWLDPIAAEFAAGEPGPVPPFAANTMRTLRALYLLADRGVRPEWNSGTPVPLRHRETLRERLAAVLALVAPFTG